MKLTGSSFQSAPRVRGERLLTVGKEQGRVKPDLIEVDLSMHFYRCAQTSIFNRIAHGFRLLAHFPKHRYHDRLLPANDLSTGTSIEPRDGKSFCLESRLIPIPTNLGSSTVAGFRFGSRAKRV